MTTSPITKLMNNLLNDEDYIKYEEIYKQQNDIDKDLLIKLLENHHDLYYLFLKINIFLNRFNTKDLNDGLSDIFNYKGKSYRISDLDCILGYYYNHYLRCLRAIKIMINDKLVPQDERELLEKIISKPVEEQIRFNLDDNQ